ncbi:MAG: hypothetical protein Q9209_002917 [Squamulea sp. 1 TL-2023]
MEIEGMELRRPLAAQCYERTGFGIANLACFASLRQALQLNLLLQINFEDEGSISLCWCVHSSRLISHQVLEILLIAKTSWFHRALTLGRLPATQFRADTSDQPSNPTPHNLLPSDGSSTSCLGPTGKALQLVLPNGRIFDPINVAANVVGSLSALALCSIYHKRMLDRRRRRKGYGMVPQDAEGQDLELGPSGAQETGVVDIGDGSSADGEGRLTPSSAGAGDDVGGGKN